MADGTLPIPMTGVGMLRLGRPEGDDGSSLSEGTLPFTLTGQGRLKIPNQWLSDGTLPLPKARELAKQLALDFTVQSGLTLPQGLKGTGKLTIPEPEDGGKPWPSIPKDMLPWVLTGSGTVNLADGTWPLPIFEMEDRIIPIKRVVDETRSTTEPVQPDESAPSIIPGPTKVGPDPVNPDDIPAVDVNPIGPSEAGPDPVNPENRKMRACCGGH